MTRQAALTAELDHARGLTLVELMIAVAILAITICATMSAYFSSHRLNVRSREEAIAVAAAQDKLAEIREHNFDDVVNAYGGQTFQVFGLNPVAPGVDQGEVIIINDETPDEAAYGRDLEAPVGPDGVDLNGNGRRTDVLGLATVTGTFPADLDGDGAATTPVVAPAAFKLIPVVVAVTWQGPSGTARVQMMTMIADRDG